MPKYVIERRMPGVGTLSARELCGVAQKSSSVLREMAPRVQWLHSYVTDDKIYCVYNADDEELVREHARRGGFPADNVARVSSVIDSITGEA